MANFKKTIATARAKVAAADAKAFQARFEAIEAILQGAPRRDDAVRARPRGSGAELLRGTPGRVQSGVVAGAGRLHGPPGGTGRGRACRGRRRAPARALRRRHERRPHRHDRGVAGGLLLGRARPESEIAYWERGEWWLSGDPKPWQPEAMTVAPDRLVFRPRLVPVA